MLKKFAAEIKALAAIVVIILACLAYFVPRSEFEATAGTVQNLVDSDRLRVLQNQLIIYKEKPAKYAAEIKDTELQIRFLKCKLYNIGCKNE